MDLAKQKAMLIARRAELIRDMQRIERALDAPLPADWEDRASERQADEMLEQHGHMDRAELNRVEAALARIEDGNYGECVKCGATIAPARLAAVPTAALCRTCAAAGVVRAAS